MIMSTVLSIEEVVESFSADLPEYQRLANYNFVVTVHASLRDGGVWASPSLGTVYTKSGEGFVELLLDPESLERPPHV